MIHVSMKAISTKFILGAKDELRQDRQTKKIIVKTTEKSNLKHNSPGQTNILIPVSSRYL